MTQGPLFHFTFGSQNCPFLCETGVFLLKKTGKLMVQEAPMPTAQRPTRRPAARIPRNMTLERFRRWKPEDGWKYEWVNGQIEKSERSMTHEQTYIARNLMRRFAQTQAYRDGAEMMTEIDTTMLQGNVRRPDVAVLTSRQLQGGKMGFPFTPAFVVEIISETDNINKVRQKLREYFQSGVQVVWHIFPQTQTVDVYTSPLSVQICEGAQVCSAGPAIPDFQMTADEVFA